MAGSLPREVRQGLELPICLAVWPFLSCSSFHSLGLFHALISSVPVLSVPFGGSLVFVLLRATALHNSRGHPFHRCSLFLGLLLTLSQC